MRDSILLIDDKEINRLILKKIFLDSYRILEASEGAQALAVTEEEEDRLAIILLDISISRPERFNILLEYKQRGYLKTIPVILMTDDSSADMIQREYDYWVADVINKPFDPQVIRRRVRNIVDLYAHKNKLETLVAKQTEKLEQQAAILKETNSQVIETLSSVVEFRGLEKGVHIQRIKEFTRLLLLCLNERFPKYNMTTEQMEKITTASSLHDVGKIAVPDRILLKPGKLTDDEFEIMKLHTIKGCDIIDSFTFMDDKEFFGYCYDICRYHHERFDGRGYPEGLKGNEIPIWAQVVSIADVYDALISERVYKSAYTPKEAYRMILSGECGVFAPEILEAFRIMMEQQAL